MFYLRPEDLPERLLSLLLLSEEPLLDRTVLLPLLLEELLRVVFTALLLLPEGMELDLTVLLSLLFLEERELDLVEVVFVLSDELRCGLTVALLLLFPGELCEDRTVVLLLLLPERLLSLLLLLEEDVALLLEEEPEPDLTVLLSLLLPEEREFDLAGVAFSLLLLAGLSEDLSVASRFVEDVLVRETVPLEDRVALSLFLIVPLSVFLLVELLPLTEDLVVELLPLFASGRYTFTVLLLTFVALPERLVLLSKRRTVAVLPVSRR